MVFGVRTAKSRYLLNEHDFGLAAARERARADRNGMSLSILVIELPLGNEPLREIAQASRILRRRLRQTDTVGRLRDGRIAALLPDTPKAGAWKVASDVCDYYPVGAARPNCEVYVYPDDGAPQRGEPLPRAAQPVHTEVAPVESLFSQPTPMIKRAVDIIGACVGLLLATPLFLLIAPIIKLTSPGPVVFAQLREGHGGRRFYMYKLRSMRVGAHQEQSALRALSVQDGPAFKMRHDPRITWIGGIIRKTSLDELPQLWNVLVGDMSLVGPRPLPVEESLQCSPWQRRRLNVKPGLTCVWQVRGRSTVSFESWMRMDLEYVRRGSVLYDVKLLLSTIPSLLVKRGPR
jgi:lipopolysaccharide/colanic/teichoic acid biosynthesis glycosyltransferase